MANKTQGTQDNTRNKQQNRQPQAAQQGKQQTQGQAEFDATYWRNQYEKEPYYNQKHTFGDYEPAYRLGSEGRQRYAGQRFDEVEGDLRGEYETTRGSSKLGWEEARDATRAAWDRSERMNTAGRDRKPDER
jgi:hypothetical protein